MTQEKLSSIYARDPIECLHAFFAKSPIPSFDPDKAFLWTSALGARSPVTYGSFKTLDLNELKGRQFLVSFLDYRPSILWTDHVHNERGGCYYGEGPSNACWPLSKASYDVHAEIEKRKKQIFLNQRALLDDYDCSRIPF